MHPDLTLISTIAAGLGLALIIGLIALRLKLPALVGYLVAGILLGPYSPGFVADAEIASQLAEMGVMLLMFGVGLHFSFDDLLSVRRIALPGALAQIGAATAMGLGLVTLWGWTLGEGIVFGLALSVASTVVLLRGLESKGILDSVNGRIAVGWLVVEDLVMVLVLVLLPPLATLLGGSGDIAALQGDENIWATLGITLGKVALFIMLMLVVGARVFPWFLWQVAKTGSRELFTLCVITGAVGIAYGSSLLFGVSFAIGAFFAGVVLRESDLSYRAAEESLPLRDAFSVLFFVSVGMLFNPRILIEQPLQILAVVAIILLGKSLAAFLIVLAFRYPLNTALTVSASLAQIGEFSFILASLGMSLGLLPQQGQSLILAGAIISIAINPLLFQGIAPIQNWLQKRNRRAQPGMRLKIDPLSQLPGSVEPSQVTGHVVLVGFGRVGKQIAYRLAENSLGFVIADQNREIVEKLRDEGVKAVAGDASDPATLIQAHIARARFLVIAVPDTLHIRKMVEIARALNPHIDVLVRTHNEEIAALFRKENIGKVFVGEYELAYSMSGYLLEKAARK